MEDMLFNMVPGSRTEPAVQSCFYLSYAAIGFIVVGIVPNMGFTAAIKPLELPLICAHINHILSGFSLNYSQYLM